MNKRISKPVGMVWFFVFLLMIATTAWGADSGTQYNSADPGVVQKSLEQKQFKQPAPMPEISIQTETGAKIKGGAGVTFTLEDVKLQGNEVLTAQALQVVIRPYLGKEITVNTLQEIADKITTFYISKGYILSRAYVPPQEIKDGRALIMIREGALGRVIVKGNQRYKKEMIARVMDVVKDRGAVRRSDLERALLLLTDYPGMTVKADLMAGERPGTTDVVVHVNESKIWGLGVDYNNFGSRYVAQDRYGLKADLYSPFGWGDELRLNYVMGQDDQLYYGRGEYTFPINYMGTRMGLSYSRSDIQAGRELRAQDYEGESDSGSVWISHPIIRTRLFNWYVNGGLDLDHSKADAMYQQIYNDRLLNARIGTEVDWIDDLYGNNSVYLNVTRGIKNSTIASTLNGKSRFTKVEAGLQRYQMVPTSGLVDWLKYDSTLIFTMNGMYSTDRLPSSQRISLGGEGSVRGYEQSEYSGDKGIYGTLEFRLPVWRPDCEWMSPVAHYGVLQLAAFIDSGYVSVNDANVSEIKSASLSGAGLGLRFQLAPYMIMKVDWAKSVGGKDPNVKNYRQDGVWYVQFSAFY